jgi:predicted DNA-binding transcriptional regulator AlpA
MTEEKYKDFLSVDDLKEYLNCSKQNIYNIIASDETFPKSYDISPKKGIRQVRRWSKNDINEWILSREINEEREDNC